MNHVSCRVPPALGTLLDEAEEERDVFRSELIRAALRHYIASNPDDYAAFCGATPTVNRSSKDRSPLSGESNESSIESEGVYDPTRSE